MTTLYEGELPSEFASSVLEDMHEGLYEYNGQTGSEYINELPWVHEDNKEKQMMFQEYLANPDQEIDDNSYFNHVNGLYRQDMLWPITARPDHEIIDDPTFGPIGNYMDIDHNLQEQARLEGKSHYLWAKDKQNKGTGGGGLSRSEMRRAIGGGRGGGRSVASTTQITDFDWDPSSMANQQNFLYPLMEGTPMFPEATIDTTKHGKSTAKDKQYSFIDAIYGYGF